MNNGAWWDATWNPVTGCSPVSEGCDNCWARRMAKRLAGRCGYPKRNPFKPMFHEDRLDIPSHWRKHRYVFVCSMGDIFHPDIANIQIDQIFTAMTFAMGGADHHTYLILTKRPWRILTGDYKRFREWKNIWLGVTVESGDVYDRLGAIYQIPAAKRFISVEPMLEDVSDIPLGGIDWVIAGKENGPGARPCKQEWKDSLRYRCLDYGVKYWDKDDPRYRERPR